MALVAVWAANLYNGLKWVIPLTLQNTLILLSSTHAWTIWVYIAVAVGPILVLGYTLVYSAIKPGWVC